MRILSSWVFSWDGTVQYKRRVALAVASHQLAVGPAPQAIPQRAGRGACGAGAQMPLSRRHGVAHAQRGVPGEQSEAASVVPVF